MEKLIFFPEPYPDEDFRSIIYRYHVRSGNNQLRETKVELFDIKSNLLTPVPSNLFSLLNKLPQGHGFNNTSFVLNTTWLPFFLPFMSTEKRSRLERGILYGNKISTPKMDAGKNVPILTNKIKYCPICMEDDYKKYGECYVHLKHQLSFIDFCTEHIVKLIDKCPKCQKDLSKKYAQSLTRVPCCSYENIKRIEHSELIHFKYRLFLEVSYFKQNSVDLNSDIFYAKLISLLGSNGYIYKGAIDKHKLLKDLTQHYSMECIQSIGNIDYLFFSKTILPRFLSRKKMVNFALIYILILMFLAGTVKNFLDSKDFYSIPIPFNPGPWSCYNTVCPSFKSQKKSIAYCERTYKETYFLGKFTCPICGFQYTRKSMLQSNKLKKDAPDEIRVIFRGNLWDKAIKEMQQRGYMIREIAEVLNTSPHIVKKSLVESKKKHNLEDKSLKEIKLSLYETAVTTSSSFSIKEQYRNKIISLVKENANLIRTHATKLAPKEYRWLLKNDSKWLYDVLPPKERNLSEKELIIMDEELRAKVRKIASIVFESNPSRQIKRFTIINKLSRRDQGRIRIYNEKLPKTLAELDFNIESREDYQVRHIPVIVAQLKLKGHVNITLNGIIADSKTYINCTEETKKRIQHVLDDILSKQIDMN